MLKRPLTPLVAAARANAFHREPHHREGVRKGSGGEGNPFGLFVWFAPFMLLLFFSAISALSYRLLFLAA